MLLTRDISDERQMVPQTFGNDEALAITWPSSDLLTVVLKTRKIHGQNCPFTFPLNTKWPCDKDKADDSREEMKQHDKYTGVTKPKYRRSN